MNSIDREKLAAAVHESWSGWMDHLFRQCETGPNESVIIPKHFVQRWHRQLNTPYAELTEPEKDSDREQADRILRAIEQSKKQKS
jgi:uncharacterized protein with von Willebrand factor type A (vWA) domain